MSATETGLADLLRPGLRLMETAAEAVGLEVGPRAEFATPNRVALDLKTMRLRDYSVAGEGLPILVHAPYAGHSSAIADFHRDQSLMACLQAEAGGPLHLTDWKSADAQTQSFAIDEYLAELVVAIDHLGGRVHLAGLCQGGWAVAMLAARFPQKVASLVLAGAPLDLMAGDGWIKRMVKTMPPVFYQELVMMGGGRLRGQTMLQGFKAMHPFKQYVERYIRLYEHIDDAQYRRRLELFSAWFEHPIDLPGPWYIQVVDELFRRNLFFEGGFKALGQTVGLADVACPVYLLAGKDDDITPAPQVFAAADRLRTRADQRVCETVPGGHVGLFMSHRTVHETWPKIARWIRGTE